MEERSEAASPSDSKQQSNLCEDCKIKASKYKCPGCSLRLCSLPCINSHKQRTGCTGKKPVTNFVPISQFDDNLFLSDYNMLEDVKRITDSAKRMRVNLCGFSNFRLPHPLKSLRNAAFSRRLKLLFLSSGMSKRQKNQTYYARRKKFISWTIEWRFHSTDVMLVDNGVHENTALSSVIENHLKPGPWNHLLRKFCDQPGPKSSFRELNIRTPIRGQLAKMVILEYPVIHVFLPSHSYDFDVINDANPSKVYVKEPTHDDHPSPKGVTFREEEIEDRGSSDPHVSDLLDSAYEKNRPEKEPKELVESPAVVKWAEHARSALHSDSHIVTTDIGSISGIEQLDDITDLHFDFESNLVDLHPDLITYINPDDFLDFDAISSEQKDLDGGKFLMVEELEEGEIA